jgi:Heparinase II/III-like protein/Heparinase II/III N-terminus
MSWDELETRLGQEISKRLDLTLSRIGLQPGRNGVRLSSTASGNFFFTPFEVSQRVSLLREHLPQQAAKIVADANEIRSHRFRLLGYRDLSYGAEIDWHLDAVHGRRSPLIPWFKIDFLDFENVGDHKVTWELNRHQHLITLAKAWLLTGTAGYADEIFAQFYSWQRANPYPLGANWASSLEVAFRSLSWIWVEHLLAQYPGTPASFREDLLRGLALNGRHIERYLSTYFSPNTHLLGEALALFFIGTLYPQIHAASRWKQMGWQTVQQEAARQVRPDGVYFEQTLYYHVYALDFLLHARLLASRNNIEIASELDPIIRKMLDFVRALSQTAPPDGFGDDDGGRLFDSSRNRAEQVTDPLALGAAMFHDESLRAGVDLTEEAIWLLGDQAIPSRNHSQTSFPLSSRVFPDGGIYVITNAQPFAQQMIIDAGPQGTGHCGHGHADALSVRLSFAGRRWLVDAGTGSYIGPDEDRNYFRGTRAHNTLAVDGLDQAQPEGPFVWSSIPDTRVETYISRATFTLFVASHSGYERLPQAVRHRRFVFHFGENLYLIRDVAIGAGTHLLETSWHFAPELEISQYGREFIAAIPRAKGATAESAHLSLLPVEDSRWKVAVRSKFVSRCYGEKMSAPVLRCAAGVALPAETAMLLATAAEAKNGRDKPTRLVREQLASYQPHLPDAVYKYEQGNVTHAVVFSRPGVARWRYGAWASDAQLLYFRMTDARIERIVLCEGTFAQFGGKDLISRDGPLKWLEWNQDGRQEQVACSDPTAVRAFAGSILGEAKI